MQSMRQSGSDRGGEGGQATKKQNRTCRRVAGRCVSRARPSLLSLATLNFGKSLAIILLLLSS
jgi:hypothetical protein